MRKLIILLFPNDTIAGHLIAALLYAGLAYGIYLAFVAWPWWYAALMVIAQLALGYLCSPFLDLLLPPQAPPK